MCVRALALQVALACLVSVALGEPTAEVTFSPSELSFSKYVHEQDTFDVPSVVSAPGCVESLGAPGLPYRLVHILIPLDRHCVGVTFTGSDSAQLEGEYSILPAQHPHMCDSSQPFVNPDSTIYGSYDPFPASPVQVCYEAHQFGYRTVTLKVFPLRYRPASGTLYYYTRISLMLQLEPCNPTALPLHGRNALTQKCISDFVAATVENPLDVPGYGLGALFKVVPLPSGKRGGVITELPSEEGLRVDYVVITSDALAGQFEEFAKAKTDKGVIATVRTVGWIQENYPGCDLQERVRNFIKDAYSNWGTAWILLGGDVSVVPERTAQGLYAYPVPYSMTSDLYYSDLESNWNQDGDTVFGEPEDMEMQGGVREYLADVWLGRAPVENAGELSIFLQKNQLYALTPPTQGDFLSKILLVGGTIRPRDTLEGEGCQDMEALQRQGWYGTSGLHQYELYGPRVDVRGNRFEGDERLNCTALINQMNGVGYHFVAHADHSSAYTLGTWTNNGANLGNDRVLTKQRAEEELVNGPKYSILWSYGCTPGGFDHECLAEGLMNNQNGGAIAFIGNTRPGQQSQHSQMYAFFGAIFGEHQTILGQAFVRSQQTHSEFYHHKNLNLLGDPDLRIWTCKVPRQFWVTVAPVELHVGEQDITVTVVEDIGGEPGGPVGGAVVCLTKRDGSGRLETIAIDTTCDWGVAMFPGVRLEVAGSAKLTVTKGDFIPKDILIPVLPSSTSFLRFNHIEAVDDDELGASHGNGDHVANPGEAIELYISLANSGGTLATDLTATLSTQDEHVALQQPTRPFPDIPPNESRVNIAPFVFTIGPERPRSPVPEITFAVDVYSGGLPLFRDEFRLMVLADTLVPGGHRVQVSPSGTAIDSLVLTNYGWGGAAGVYLKLRCSTPGYVITDSVSEFGDIPGLATDVSYDGLSFTQEPAAPDPDFSYNVFDRYGRHWTLAPVDFEAPFTPGTPYLQYSSPTTLRLGWARHYGDLRGYNVYRKTGSSDYVKVNAYIVDSTATYTDRDLQPYTDYWYKVAGIDYSGNQSGLSAALQVRTAPPLHPGWPAFGSCSWDVRSAVECGNVTGDARLEVVAAMGCSIYVWNSDGALLSGWPKFIGRVATTTPALGDADGDGLEEIFMAVEGEVTLHAWTGTGAEMPGWPTHLLENDTIQGTLSLADADQDGSLEVLFGAGYKLYCVGGSGQVRWRAPMQHAGLTCRVVGAAPAIADLDVGAETHDAELEIVIGGGVLLGSTCVFAFNHDGSVFGNWPYLIASSPDLYGSMTSPSIGDLDADGRLEVIFPVSATSSTYCFAWDGSLLPSGVLTASSFASAALADLDGDSRPEVIMTCGSELRCWRFTGTGFQGVFTANAGRGLSQAPTVADITGDVVVEILTGGYESMGWTQRMQAFTAEGQEIQNAGFPMFPADIPPAALTITDLDLDGNSEMVGSFGDGGYVCVWDLPAGYSRQRTEWSAPFGNIRHTGLYAQPMQGNYLHNLNWWGRYKLLGDVTVTGFGLNVQPGTWVQAGNGTAMTGVTVNGGAFNARGTRAAPTFFEPAPSVPNWTGVRVNNGSASVFDCSFTGAFEGLSATNCASLQISGDTFTNCQIGGITSLFSPAPAVKDCYFNGNQYYDICVRNAVAPSEIKSNRFTNSGHYGIWVESSVAPVIADNVLVNTQPMSQYGIKCFSIPSAGQALGNLRHNTIAGYGQGGILCQASSPRIDGHNNIYQNTVFGLNCLDYSCPVVESSTVIYHYAGVMAAGQSYPNLGRIMLPVPSGYNSIFSNWGYNVVNANNLPTPPIMAQRNWWGQSLPDPTKFLGNVVYNPWLTQPPSDGAQGQPVATTLPLELGQGRPNPFSSATRVMLANPTRQRLVVGVYDITGRLVQTLLDAVAPPGKSWLSWDGSDAHGRQVASGVYFCRLNAGQEKKVSRIVYVRGK